MTAPVAKTCVFANSPLSPNGAVRLRFSRWGDFRNTGRFAKPSMFSRIKPRPCGKLALALVRMRLGVSSAFRPPWTTVFTVPWFPFSSVTVPATAGEKPP